MSSWLPNDSQLTLVEYEPPLELVLDRASTPLNTSICINGRARYQVSTVNGRDSRTTDITDLLKRTVIASYKTRAIFSDKVKFPHKYGGNWIKKDDWLKRTKSDSGGYVDRQ